jgi:hypothetical protein
MRKNLRHLLAVSGAFAICALGCQTAETIEGHEGNGMEAETDTAMMQQDTAPGADTAMQPDTAMNDTLE